MPEVESVASVATAQDVLNKLNEATEMVQTAQEQLVADVTQALEKLAVHETDPNAHGGSVGGGSTPPGGGSVSADELASLRSELETMIQNLSTNLVKNLDPWNCIPCRVPIPVDGVTFPMVEQTRPVLDEAGQPVPGEDGEPLTETVTVRSRHPIMPGETNPRENWLICDGGDDGQGGTVPLIQGRVILGASESHPAGETGGSEEHSHSLSGTVGGTTLSVAQMPSHGHDNGTTLYTGHQRYNEFNTTGSRADGNTTKAPLKGGYTDWQGASASHSHTLSGASATQSNLQPYYSLSYVMRIA